MSDIDLLSAMLDKAGIKYDKSTNGGFVDIEFGTLNGEKKLGYGSFSSVFRFKEETGELYTVGAWE